uniref:Ig-like domain-containing protein n=1 Tax=Periophthalmus magnuspinnatus TaxID=409849 RepID=A0A3B4AIP0_9GOBI
MTTKLISTTKKNEITSTSLPNIFTIPMKRVEEKVEQSGWVTPTYSTRDSVRLTTQFRMPTKPIPLPKLVPNLQSEPKASPRIVPESKILTQHVVKVTEKPKLKAETDDYPIQMPNGSFLIKSVQLQDRGQYLCTAQNRFGSDRSVITLAVQTQPPKIQPPQSTEFSLYLGHSAALPCLASGRPTAQISWILPDRTFVRDVGAVHSILAPMVLFSNGTLQIHSANFSSKGDYKCIASNAAGADTVTYHVHVAALPPSISEKAIDTVIIQPGRTFLMELWPY